MNAKLSSQSEQARHVMMVTSKRLRDAILASGIPHHVVQDTMVIDLDHPSCERALRFMEHYGKQSVQLFQDLHLLTEQQAREMLAKFKGAYPELAKRVEDPQT